MKRYYLIIYKKEQKSTDKESDNYWKQLSEGVYHINSSENIIKQYQKYNQWHKKNNYIFLDDKHIIDNIKDITNNKL
jgi:hypothetical protein